MLALLTTYRLPQSISWLHGAGDICHIALISSHFFFFSVKVALRLSLGIYYFRICNCTLLWLRSHLVPRSLSVTHLSGFASAPLSAVDAERHISGHEQEAAGGGGGWNWQGAGAGSPVARSSSMDDVLAEAPAWSERGVHSWHRRQSWAPERHGEGRPVAGGAAPTPGLPEPCHQRSRSCQQEMADRAGNGVGRPRPAGVSNTWERRGQPPAAPPGASSTWERGATAAPRAPYGASNTWERGGRTDPQFAPPESSWERKAASGPASVGGSWDHMSDGGASAPYGGTWERGKDSMRVRGPMAMSWQTDRRPVPPPRTRPALPGMASGAGAPAQTEPGGLSVGRGSVINQSAPSLAFDAIDARRPPVSALAARRASPSSLSDLRALRPDLSDGHNEGYRRTAERLAGRSESPRTVPAAGERPEGLWMPPVVAERPLGRTEEGAVGSGRPVVPPRPGRRPVPAASEQQKMGQSQPPSQPAPVRVSTAGGVVVFSPTIRWVTSLIMTGSRL